MKLTKETLKQIIKEELDAVLELRSVDGKPTTRDQRKAMKSNPGPGTMGTDAETVAFGMKRNHGTRKSNPLSKSSYGWDDLTPDIKAELGEKAKEDKNLAAAIKDAKAMSKGEQEDG